MSYNKYSSVYNGSGIWEMWHKKTYDDYTIDFYKEEVQKITSEESKSNVLLYGNNGTGKTMLMNLAMKELLHKDKSVYVIDFRNLVKEYTKSWRGEGKLGHLMSVDYLAIDDLGKEFSSGAVSKELAITTLDYVLRYRVQREKPTWMTFNLMLSDIGATYNKHIASLVKRNTIAIAFDGEDYGNKLYKKIER